jgi:hypothetical protein
VGDKTPEGVGRALTLRAEVSEGPGGGDCAARGAGCVRVVSEPGVGVLFVQVAERRREKT